MATHADIMHLTVVNVGVCHKMKIRNDETRPSSGEGTRPFRASQASPSSASSSASSSSSLATLVGLALLDLIILDALDALEARAAAIDRAAHRKAARRLGREGTDQRSR